ncbi:RNA-directed DNA polymerase from mobile element jockey [Trichonephila clavipes]|nr:RNA-directed DNA polymerase from mobile element jockey [Trichonephila clavipes]
MDYVILNHGQVTWTTPELAPRSPNYHTTPTGGRFISRQVSAVPVFLPDDRTLPPLLDSMVGGGTSERSFITRLWIQVGCARPFAIHKALIGIGGEPISVKRLRSGDLLIETSSALQTNPFLLAKLFLDCTVTISPHKTLNSSRGVIS